MNFSFEMIESIEAAIKSTERVYVCKTASIERIEFNEQQQHQRKHIHVWETSTDSLIISNVNACECECEC